MATLESIQYTYDEVGDEPLHWHGLIQDTVGSWGLEEECTPPLSSPPASKHALVSCAFTDPSVERVERATPLTRRV